MTVPRKPGFVLPIAATLAVLLGYVLSDGLAMGLTRRANSRTARACYRLAYTPLNWLARRSPAMDEALTTLDFWWDRRLPKR